MINEERGGSVLTGLVTDALSRVFVVLIIAWVSVCPAYGGELRLSMDDYRDKMQGAWIGQMVGVEWGMPTEFKWNNVIIPEDKVPKWTPQMINGGFKNDDLYVEMTFLKTLEDFGLMVGIRQAGIDFANSRYGLWCANQAGRQNLRMGIAPPDCSHPRFHRCSNDIDYQIEADYSGIISPGLPQEVIRLGNVFGRLVNYGDGVWAGQFIGALYAKAFFTTDVNSILDAGLAAIPAESDYAQMVRDVRNWHRGNANDWVKTWEKIRQKYCKQYNPKMKDTNGGIDARLNGAMVVLGLLCGDGDLDRAMSVSMRCGYDSDCNPSSVGGVLMCARGAKSLDAKYASELKRKEKFNYSAYDFDQLCEVCEKLARQVVVLHGGRIEKDIDGHEWLVIPERPPVPDAWQPSWKAAEPVGSRYSEAEMARQREGVYFRDLDGVFSTNPTTRVQATLDGLMPGWKTTENGDCGHPGCGISGTVCRIGDRPCLTVVTHPPSHDKPVSLFRTMTVPQGNPILHFDVANVRGGDFRLEVKVDGICLLATEIADSFGISGADRILRPFDISLNPWKGQTVKIELVNRPTGWNGESAIWHDVRVDSLKQ